MKGDMISLFATERFLTQRRLLGKFTERVLFRMHKVVCVLSLHHRRGWFFYDMQIWVYLDTILELWLALNYCRGSTALLLIKTVFAPIFGPNIYCCWWRSDVGYRLRALRSCLKPPVTVGLHNCCSLAIATSNCSSGTSLQFLGDIDTPAPPPLPPLRPLWSAVDNTT